MSQAIFTFSLLLDMRSVNLHFFPIFDSGNKLTIWLDDGTYFRLRIYVVGVVP
jgi:hypothetical protein